MVIGRDMRLVGAAVAIAAGGTLAVTYFAFIELLRLAVSDPLFWISILEAVNVFNHVNLGNPDSEVGVPGNNNTNAGRITSTAYGTSDPQRNVQFGVKFTF